MELSIERKMESFHYFIVFVCFVFIYKLLQKRRRNLPPSPIALPIVGHLYLLKKPIHRTLSKLSEKYGDIFFLQLGSRPALVITSSSAFEECFGKNDEIFANRPPLMIGKYISYNNTTIGMSPYGPLWRNLRRIAAIEILSSSRVNMFSSVRVQEVHSLVRHLFRGSSSSFKKVELRSRLSAAAYNIMTGMIADQRYYGEDLEDFEEAKRFRELTEEIFSLGLTSNLGDSFPWLAWMDLQGVVKRMKKSARKRDAMLQKMIDKRRRIADVEDTGREERKTMIDVLLSLQKTDPDYYTDEILMGLIWGLLSGATETSTTTLEWGMTLLLMYPDTLKKARSQLDDIVGHDRVLDESDLPKLPFLRCIINETLRLYPPTPVLLHSSSQDCIVRGYNIPAGTMLLANLWSVHRDPELWEDAASFRPERFLSMEADREGFKWIPFGAGRRVCPGSAVGTKITCLVLGALIQCFDWRRLGEEVDMSERPGLAMFRAQKLEAFYAPRQEMFHTISKL
ncbi:cytochrome P450 81Q32-like [Aristolochia californica]|uniref:cytochrome P450 81Q32-like n=1 Tax=Aristolochia californica TaxID=171875 RepID=UPI0035DE2307